MPAFSPIRTCLRSSFREHRYLAPAHDESLSPNCLRERGAPAPPTTFGKHHPLQWLHRFSRERGRLPRPLQVKFGAKRRCVPFPHEFARFVSRLREGRRGHCAPTGVPPRRIVASLYVVPFPCAPRRGKRVNYRRFAPHRSNSVYKSLVTRR
jgi:hypothetical protein